MDKKTFTRTVYKNMPKAGLSKISKNKTAYMATDLGGDNTPKVPEEISLKKVNDKLRKEEKQPVQGLTEDILFDQIQPQKKVSIERIKGKKEKSLLQFSSTNDFKKENLIGNNEILFQQNMESEVIDHALDVITDDDEVSEALEKNKEELINIFDYLLKQLED